MRSTRILRNPIAWGATALAFGAVVALALAYIYAHPPGQNKILAFYTDDAAAIRTGQEVRMAGITVGKVDSVSLEPNQVLVKARINDDAFVGEQSQIDVRMLTVVGGYYVNVASIGGSPLGGNVVPKSRVTMPYSLVRTLTDTTKLTENINTAPVNESLNQIENGLTGTNVQVISTVINAGNELMSTIDRQRGQVTRILNMSDEYIKSFSDYKDKFSELIREASIVTQSLIIYNTGLAGIVDGLSDTLLTLKPVADFYEAHRVEFTEKVREYLEKGRMFVERNGLTIRALRRVQNLLDRVLNAQDAPPALLATDMCVPLPGIPC